MGKMNFTPLDDLLDEDLGKIGTPKRDAFEAKLAEELRAYHVGEAIKKARQAHNLSQDQLGERMGVKKSQISKIESGRNITFSTMIRAFKALGISASLNCDGIEVALS